METVTTSATHQGQIVAEYRRHKNWTQEELANALRVDARTVQRMERQDVINNVTRRRLLVGLLGIPAALMGLEEEQRQAEKVAVAFNQDRMSFFEDEMTTRWEMYHTGGTTRAARGIERWTQEIAKLAAAARGTAWEQRAYVLLAMSYQLQNCTYRDMLRFDEAHQAYLKAVKIGRDIDNPELIASAMAREGVTLIQHERASEAVDYLKAALGTIDHVGLPNLRGYILQALSEAHAKLREPQLSWQCLAQAERTLERGQRAPEMNQARFSIASVTAQKGVNAVLLKDDQRAIALIDRSLTKYDPTLVRGRARLIAQKAEAYYNLRLLDACVVTAEEALTLANSVGSSKTVSRVEKLHANLAQSPWRKEPSVARLGALLSS